jgi:Tol biopolymer transport system component
MTESGKSDIYICDLNGQTTMRRLTRPGNNRLPAWSRDGTRIAYQSDREGDRAIFCERADSSGAVERLTIAAKDEAHEPEAWSPGDKMLLFSLRRTPIASPATAIQTAGVVLSALSLKTREVHVFEEVPSATPAGTTFSPDGKWVAYAQTSPPTLFAPERRGKTTIIVQPFPPTGARYELAHDGRPNHPQWSRDGKELFFVPGPEQFKAVPVTVSPKFSFGIPISLPRSAGNAHTLKPRAYDVMRDGRFIGAVWRSGTAEGHGSDIVVVVNWLSELKMRVPRP